MDAVCRKIIRARRRCLPFERGSRPIWVRRYMALHIIRKIRFALFGYSFMRLRSFMKSIAGFCK